MQQKVLRLFSKRISEKNSRYDRMLIPNVDLYNKTILITGAAGFIGSNLVMELLRAVNKVTIVGLDNMNDYYDVSIKEYRLQEIEKLAAEKPESEWIFVKGSIADKTLVEDCFAKYAVDLVVNLAAQAGVRYSITNPDVYREQSDRFLQYSGGLPEPSC